MNDLISRQEAIDAVNELTYPSSLVDVKWKLMQLPPAQQKQIGKWVPSTKYKGFLTCSICEDCYIESWSNRERKWKYCPQCGVRMIGGEYEWYRGE